MLIFCETETIKLWKGSRCCEARVNFLGTPVTRRHFAPSAPEATRFWRVPRRHGRGPARPPLGVLRRLGLHPAGPGGALRRDAGGRAHHRRRRRLERRIGRGGAGVLHHHGVGRGDRSGGVRGAAPPRSPLAETAGLQIQSGTEPTRAPRGGRLRTNRSRLRPRSRTANAVLLRDRGRRSRGARGVRARCGAGATGRGGALEQARARAPARGARRTNRRDRRRRKHLPLAFSFGRDVGPGGVLLFGRRHLRARPTALPAEAEGEMCCRDAKDARTRAREHGEISRREEDGNGRRRRRAKIFAKHETRRREGRRERRRRVSRPAVRRRRSFGARRERETNGARPDLRRIFIRGRHRVGTFGIKPRRLERRGDGGGDGVRGADA